jgi:ribosome-binding factor A
MTQHKTYRIQQINKLLKDEISSILLTELQDDRLLTITVTEVRASRDLHNAIVFITTHKNDNTNTFLDAVNKRSGYIRKLLYARLRLRRIPAMEFRYDDSLDIAERIFSTLEDVDQGSEDEMPEV